MKPKNKFSGNGTRCSTEDNDCSVIAISYVLDIPYEQAHAMCKAAGRNNGKPFYIQKVLPARTGKEVAFVMSNGVYLYEYKRRPHLSVRRLLKKFPKGRFIVGVSGHAFAVIDGKLLNQADRQQHVEFYYKVSFLKKSSMPLKAAAGIQK